MSSKDKVVVSKFSSAIVDEVISTEFSVVVVIAVGVVLIDCVVSVFSAVGKDDFILDEKLRSGEVMPAVVAIILVSVSIK